MRVSPLGRKMMPNLSPRSSLYLPRCKAGPSTPPGMNRQAADICRCLMGSPPSQRPGLPSWVPAMSSLCSQSLWAQPPPPGWGRSRVWGAGQGFLPGNLHVTEVRQAPQEPAGEWAPGQRGQAQGHPEGRKPVPQQAGADRKWACRWAGRRRGRWHRSLQLVVGSFNLMQRVFGAIMHF